MFGIGLPEMLIIGLVALVVLGPDRLPEAARNLGKTIADIRRATEPARSAWTEMTTEINSVITPSTATGNPWTVHPILQNMTPEEREIYMKGGDMPERVAQEVDLLHREPRPGPLADTPEVADLDYPMPHAEASFRPSAAYSAEPEPILYPPPATINQTEYQEESRNE